MNYVRMLITGVNEDETVSRTTKEYELRLGQTWLSMEPPKDTLSLIASYLQQVHKDLAELSKGVQ